MPSQTDLDQGGTYRQWVRRFLGPSVGWVWTPQDNVVPVSIVGVTSVVVGTTLVPISVNGNVTIQLPSAKASQTATAGAIPGESLALPITIVDVGGFVDGSSVLYTILPYDVETIIGLPQIQIASPFGGFTLFPDIVNGGWNQQP